MRADIIDELRPGAPDIDPTWESETMRAILDSAPVTTSRSRRLVRLLAVAAVVVTLAGGAILARTSLPNDDVRPSGPASEGPSPAPSATPTPEASPTAKDAPAPERTYVPAPGDPTTHELTVTIRDRGRSYTAGTCRATRAGTDAPDRLAFSGPDRQFEDRPLEDGEFPVPEQATRLADGTCEATLTVTLPYAPRYRVGIAREGGGIAGPDDPGETRITTRGASQDVVVVNYAG